MRYLLAVGLAARLLASSASTPLPPFVDATATSRIDFRSEAGKTPDKYLIEAMGGGIAMIDADGDGRLDLFFVNGAALHSGMGPTDKADKSDPRFWNRLYRNQGDGSFRDITNQSGLRGNGYGQGVAVGDCDNDGKPDLYVTGLGANALYRNQGGGVFADITTQAGTTSSGWSTSAGFIDFDRDGKLGLFVARYLDWDFAKNKSCGGDSEELRAYCHPNEFAPVTHLLYRNLGACKFENVSVKSGITKSPGKGLGVAFEDMDRDGRPDIFVANDSFPQRLFRNGHNGTFEEIALPSGLAYDEDGKVFAGIGTAFADYVNDGWPDVFVNALANQGCGLFHNKKGLFEYVSASTGLARISKLHSGWGTHFFDYGNDGWKDIFVAQGHVMDNIELKQPGIRYRETPLLLRNTDAKFVDVSTQAGAPFQSAMAARGAAFGGLNSGGAVDVVVATNSGPPRVLKNNTTNQGWLLIETIGTKSNHDGIGASGREQFGFVSTTGSYLSAHDRRMHFGLGQDRELKLIEIRRPSGTVQTWKNIASNQIFIARENS